MWLFAHSGVRACVRALTSNDDDDDDDDVDNVDKTGRVRVSLLAHPRVVCDTAIEANATTTATSSVATTATASAAPPALAVHAFVPPLFRPATGEAPSRSARAEAIAWVQSAEVCFLVPVWMWLMLRCALR